MRQQATPLIVLSLAIAACVTGACRPQFEPDKDAILYYFRKARVNGEVRRIWSEGQKYVDKVLEADAKLQEELDALRHFRILDSLWPRRDPRWRDPEQVGEHVIELLKLLDGQCVERRTLLRKLTEAVDEVPASLGMSGDDRTAFVDRVWESLVLHGTTLRAELHDSVMQLEETLRARFELLRAVERAAGGFDPEAAGLKVKDPTLQAEIDRRYGEIEDALRQHREAFLQYAEAELLASARAGEITDRRERKYQSARRTYLRKQLESIPKRLQNLIERTKEEKARAKPASKITFLTQWIEELTREHKELKARVDAIQQRVKEAGA